MKPVIDLEKTYGIVFDGGGARGAYQIGAWKAMREAGVKISTVAGNIGRSFKRCTCLAWGIWSERRKSGRRSLFQESWM